jgi:hypothetical protein
MVAACARSAGAARHRVPIETQGHPCPWPLLESALQPDMQAALLPATDHEAALNDLKISHSPQTRWLVPYSLFVRDALIVIES